MVRAKPNTFTYEFNGRKIVLPKFGHLKFGIVRKLRKLDMEEQFFAMLEEIFKNDPETMDFLDEMDQQEILDMVTAWQEDSGVGLGESKPS